MLANEYNLKMHVQNLGYPLTLMIGAQNHFFDVFDYFAT